MNPAAGPLTRFPLSVPQLDLGVAGQHDLEIGFPVAKSPAGAVNQETLLPSALVHSCIILTAIRQHGMDRPFLEHLQDKIQTIGCATC